MWKLVRPHRDWWRVTRPNVSLDGAAEPVHDHQASRALPCNTRISQTLNVSLVMPYRAWR